MKKSDWLRAFNQFIIACELYMMIAIFAAYIAFIMSSSMSAWLLSPLECSPQNKIAECFASLVTKYRNRTGDLEFFKL